MVAQKVSELVGVILYVQDMNLQVAFYRDILGLSVKDPEGVKDFRDFYTVELSTGPCSLILHSGGRKFFAEEDPGIVFLVSDVHALRNELLEKGVEMDGVYSPTLGVYACNGHDPEGNVFSIQSRQDIPPTVGMMIETTGAVPTYVSIKSGRGRSIVMLRDNKWIIAAEVILLIIFLCLLPFLKVVPLFSVFLLIMALLWLRGNTWNKLGLGHPQSWRATIILGASAGMFFLLLQTLLIVPVITHLVGRGLDLHTFSPVHGNLLLFIGYLITTWTSAAFGEEMIFRAYLMNRLTDLFGLTFWGRVLALLIQAVIFGILHSYQGFTGVIVTVIYGLLLGLLYFGTRRNLWTCAIAHGLNDTIAFTLTFLGL